MNANDELGRTFAEVHPADAARVLERAIPEEAAAFLKDIPIAAAVEVVQRMNVGFAAASLSALEIGHAVNVIEGLPLYHAAHLLRHSNPRTAEKLLESVAEKVARPLKRLLRYREGTAGALADPQVLTLPDDMTVAEAQKQLRRLARDASTSLYVTDRDHRLVGVISIRELLLARSKQTLDSVMQKQPTRLNANSDLADVAVDPAWLEFDMLPVVDKANAFLGAIRHKTIRQWTDSHGEGPSLVFLLDTALSIADMYWRSVSGLAAGLAVAAAAQRDDRSHESRR